MVVVPYKICDRRFPQGARAVPIVFIAVGTILAPAKDRANEGSLLKKERAQWLKKEYKLLFVDDEEDILFALEDTFSEQDGEEIGGLIFQGI